MIIAPVLVFLGLCIVGYDSYLDAKIKGSDDGAAKNSASNPVNVTDTKPLLLTPLLKDTKINFSPTAAQVKLPQIGKLESYAGYFQVDEKFKSEDFFWFFKALENPSKAPVVLWLNGGPGSSSMFGLFKENGPLQVGKDGKVTLRPVTWAKTLSMLYIDNPAGTGFSFTSSEDGYPRSLDAVTDQLYAAITQFFQLFHDLLENEFYIAGQSYAGKYGPALASRLHKEIKAGKCKIKLSGLAIGNGLIDPPHMLEHGRVFYETGLFDLKAKSEGEKMRDDAIADIEKQDFSASFYTFLDFITGTAQNITQLPNRYHFLQDELTFKMDEVKGYLGKKEVRDSIHVGNTPFVDSNTEIYFDLAENDWMKSTAPLIGELLEADYKIMLYSGHLDLMVPYATSMAFLEHLQWKGADAYKNAQRQPWMVDGKLVGYVKIAEKLTDVMIRNSGHFVPMDQPQAAFDMINNFVFNKPFF